ncbi:MAG: DNA primase [Treponema bryantii]|nr:DNA primase [Treponema bryantii]
MSGFISQDTINNVRDSSDIISVIGEYTKLDRKTGNKWWGCCPFHSEKTPSFQVDADKKFYYCFGCHAAGDVIKFTMEMEHLSYPDAITTLAKKSGIPIKYDNNGNHNNQNQEKQKEIQSIIEQNINLYEGVSTSFHYMLTQTEQGKFAYNYIKERGLTDETIEKFKIGYSPNDRFWLKKFLKGKNYSDDFLNESGLFSKNYKDICLFSDRLMFPIFNRNGKVVAFGGRILHQQGPKDSKYLNSPELIHYKKRETLYAFNFAKNSIRTNKTVIFCEGYMDCIAYHQCGLDYAVAPLGTALTEEHLKLIRGFADTILLSFDSDNAGQAATLRAVYMARRLDFTVKIIKLSGGKDPAEIMLKYGPENLTMQVKNSILDSDYLLNRLGEKYPIDTPEGKTKAALEYFEYIDSLQSDIQKESCLDQLSQAFNLKPEAVKRDFLNRNQARERLNIRKNNHQSEEKTKISLNAELRGIIAVLADLDKFKVVRQQIKADDFQNQSAKSLFIILEECFNRNAFSIPEILNRCEPELSGIITNELSNEVYQDDNVDAVIQDTVKLIKKNSIDKQRDALLKRIREFTVITEDDAKQLDILLKQKMELDKQVQSN